MDNEPEPWLYRLHPSSYGKSKFCEERLQKMANDIKMVKLSDFLSDEQIQQAWEIFEKSSKADQSAGWCARMIDEQVIAPNMVTINEKLGQENDSRYLAYMIEHTFNQAVLGKKVKP